MKPPTTPTRMILGGCEVDLVSFSFSPTYEGWIEGYPNPQMNSSVRDFAVEKAKGMARSREARVWVIESDARRTAASPIDTAPTDYVQLPRYCCIGRFESFWEELMVVWFQDELPVRVRSKITKEFDAVPWEKVATQFRDSYDDLS